MVEARPRVSIPLEGRGFHVTLAQDSWPAHTTTYVETLERESSEFLCYVFTTMIEVRYVLLFELKSERSLGDLTLRWGFHRPPSEITGDGARRGVVPRVERLGSGVKVVPEGSYHLSQGNPGSRDLGSRWVGWWVPAGLPDTARLGTVGVWTVYPTGLPTPRRPTPVLNMVVSEHLTLETPIALITSSVSLM